jgi:hypothetical protein
VNDRSSEPDARRLGLAEWLAVLADRLPPGCVDQVGAAEYAALLDLARIAAHRSERVAAPISTFVVGLAWADLPREERLGRLRELVTTLDHGG